MNPLKKENGIVYVTLENGKTYKLESVLNRHAYQQWCREIRDDRTRRRLWWRTHVVSRDMPNSKAERADLSDGGKGADLVRNASSDATIAQGVNFYNGRMSKAVAYLCRCQHIQYDTPEYRELRGFLWAVFHNRRKCRADTLAQLQLTRSAYFRRLDRYSRALAAPDWPRYLAARR